MIWFFGLILVPVVVLALLFLSAMGDFWQIITLRVDFTRLLGDLVHVLLILGLGAAAELFCLYELVIHVL